MRIVVALDMPLTWSAMGPIVVALSSSDGATESNVTDKLILWKWENIIATDSRTTIVQL